MANIENGVSIERLLGGLRPSRQTGRLVAEAYGLGIDPTPSLQAAAQAAQDGRRNKVGVFGGAATHLRGLEDTIYRTRAYRNFLRFRVEKSSR